MVNTHVLVQWADCHTCERTRPLPTRRRFDGIVVGVCNMTGSTQSQARRDHQRFMGAHIFVYVAGEAFSVANSLENHC